LRVKVKAADYIRLHHLLTGVSARTIWEHLAEGRSLDPITDRVPGDFAAWVHAVAAELGGAYRAVEADCRRVLADAEDTDRALAAERFRRSGANTAVLFKMLDQRPYDQIIWRAVRPTPGRVFRIDAG
jgi:RNA ligase